MRKMKSWKYACAAKYVHVHVYSYCTHIQWTHTTYTNVLIHTYTQTQQIEPPLPQTCGPVSACSPSAGVYQWCPLSSRPSASSHHGTTSSSCPLTSCHCTCTRTAEQPFVGAWMYMYGSMGTWRCGSMKVREHGNMEIWSMDVWEHGVWGKHGDAVTA